MDWGVLRVVVSDLIVTLLFSAGFRIILFLVQKLVVSELSGAALGFQYAATGASYELAMVINWVRRGTPFPNPKASRLLLDWLQGSPVIGSPEAAAFFVLWGVSMIPLLLCLSSYRESLKRGRSREEQQKHGRRAQWLGFIVFLLVLYVFWDTSM